MSDSLKAIFTCWFTGGDLAEEVQRQGIDRIYSPASWHCLMAGYGNFPAAGKLVKPARAIDLDEVDRFVAGCASNFPSHADALARLANPAS